MDRSGHQGIEETAAQPACSFLTSGDARGRSGVRVSRLGCREPSGLLPTMQWSPRTGLTPGGGPPGQLDHRRCRAARPTCRLLGAVELGRQRPGDREHRGPVDQHRPLAPAPTRQIRGVSRGPRSTAGRSRPPISTAFRRQARTLCSMRPGHDAVVLHPSTARSAADAGSRRAGRQEPRRPPGHLRCRIPDHGRAGIRPCSQVEVDARPLRRRARQAWSRRSIRRRRIVSLLAGRLPARR
jgi:hypothetical protein